MIASPLEVYERKNDEMDVRHYRELVREQEVERIVVGLPVHTSGREGQLAGLAQQWGTWLASATGLPVAYADERYTSVEADNLMIQSASRDTKEKVCAIKPGGSDPAPGISRRRLSRSCVSMRAARRPGGACRVSTNPVSTLIVGCGYLGKRVGSCWCAGVNSFSGPCAPLKGQGRSPVWESRR